MRGVERGCEGGKDLVDFRLSVVRDVLRRDDVHRNRRLDGGPRRARAYHHDFVERERRGLEPKIRGHRVARNHGDPLLGGFIADQPSADGVGSGWGAQVVAALRVRHDAARRPDHHDAGARDGRAALGTAYGARYGAGLLGAERSPTEERDGQQHSTRSGHGPSRDSSAQMEDPATVPPSALPRCRHLSYSPLLIRRRARVRYQGAQRGRIAKRSRARHIEA